ncbi:hypothetical protein, partial [Neisseria sp. HMSC064D07]|uniref:hypothetical protein n=1 Tax=Neisseria sp. HMSC064D07 TaxID=1715087 RepID=UPI001AEF699A
VERDVLNLVHDDLPLSKFSKFAHMGGRAVRNPDKDGRTYSPFGYCIRRPRGHRKLRLYRNKPKET